MACDQIEYCGECEHYGKCAAEGFTKCKVNLNAEAEKFS